MLVPSRFVRNASFVAVVLSLGSSPSCTTSDPAGVASLGAEERNASGGSSGSGATAASSNVAGTSGSQASGGTPTGSTLARGGDTSSSGGESSTGSTVRPTDHGGRSSGGQSSPGGVSSSGVGGMPTGGLGGGASGAVVVEGGAGGLGDGGTAGRSTGGVNGVADACDVDVGCEPVRECGEQAATWECDSSWNDPEMVAGGCVDQFTGLQRYCCPSTFRASCLPSIELESSTYVAGSEIAPRWENPTGEVVFLPGCSTVVVERWVDGEWQDQGPPIVCVTEGVAVEVESGESFLEPAVTLNDPGTYRFTGTYSFECVSGEPLSSAGCRRSQVPTASAVFFVE